MKSYPFKEFSSIFVLLLLIISFLISCNKENKDIPTDILLSNTVIYELLPAGTLVGKFSTNFIDKEYTYRLVSGEGDSNNQEFEIAGNILRSKVVLDYDDGSMRSIRVRAIDTEDNEISYEKPLVIQINDFSGIYPTLSSPSFSQNEFMPKEFGADHGNVSPDLELMNIPSETTSIMLTMIDLDDNRSYHWAVWNIPPEMSSFNRSQNWTTGIIEGENNFGEGYTGPFPPSEHRYQISAYFLNKNINLEAKEYNRLISESTGAIIAQAILIGKYKP